MTEQEMEAIKRQVEKELSEKLDLNFSNGKVDVPKDLTITEVRKLSNKMAKIKKDKKIK